MPEMKQLMLSQLFQNAKAAAGCIAFFQEYTANQEYQNALVQFQKMGKSLDVITGWLVQERKILPQEAFFQILSQVGRALENQDYILMSDLLGQMLLPALFSLMNDFYENFSRQELGLLPETERNDGVRSWRIEYNNSGEATLAVREKEKDLYFHSNVNAGLEGWHFARNSVDSEVDEYIVLGLGLFLFTYALTLLLERYAKPIQRQNRYGAGAFFYRGCQRP